MVHAKPRQSCKEIFQKLEIITFPSMCIKCLIGVLYTKLNMHKFKTNASVTGYITPLGVKTFTKNLENRTGPKETTIY